MSAPYSSKDLSRIRFAGWGKKKTKLKYYAGKKKNKIKRGNELNVLRKLTAAESCDHPPHGGCGHSDDHCKDPIWRRKIMEENEWTMTSQYS